jgi:integrase
VSEDVDVAVVRTDLEKQVFRPVPVVQHFLDHVLMPVQSETNRPLIRLPPRVALHLHSHPFILAQDAKAGTGLRLGELRGLTWGSYEPAQDEESLGWLNVTRSVWRNTVGDPKTAKSKAPVPVIPQLAQRLKGHRQRCGNPVAGPIFANSVGHPLDLNACYQREMKDVFNRAGIAWHGWHGFRRGLASNLNRIGVDDSVIQRILRHSNVATTQNHYIKTASPDAIAAMRQFSEA